MEFCASLGVKAANFLLALMEFLSFLLYVMALNGSGCLLALANRELWLHWAISSR